MRQPPNKMTKGGLSFRVQWVAKVLDHVWKVTSTVWGLQLPLDKFSIFSDVFKSNSKLPFLLQPPVSASMSHGKMVVKSSMHMGDALL